MRAVLIFLIIVLVIAAIVKPQAPVPGLGGWVRDYAVFLRTCLRVGVVGFLLMLVLSMFGLIPF